jgi:general stress protein YciG
MPEKARNKNQREEEGQPQQPRRSGRGFAGMDPERQRSIASEGGRAAHEQGKAHKFTPEEAREAGRKGGMASGSARARKAREAQAQRAAQENAGQENREQNLQHEEEPQEQEI